VQKDTATSHKEYAVVSDPGFPEDVLIYSFTRETLGTGLMNDFRGFSIDPDPVQQLWVGRSNVSIIRE
jgi:hypothetical protein